MSTTLVSPPVVKAKSLSCPGCGSAVELRGFAHTLSVVCPSCLSVLDATTPEFKILQTFQGKQRVQPKIPLGSRGTLAGTLYEVIGFQQREVFSDGTAFCWDEYLLFNPYKGFRYLSEYQGHWNFIRVLNALPVVARFGSKPHAFVLSQKYTGFDRMNAQTGFVLGEFPWQVRMGDSAGCEDFISPPYMLSSESTGSETTWSLGEYTAGTQLWQAFKLPGSPPAPSGIFANQPSPHAGKSRSAWRLWLWLNVLLAAIALLFMVGSPGRQVYGNSYYFSPTGRTEASFVTPSFELTGRQSNVQLAIRTDLSNNWAYFNFALINDETGQAFDFGREVSFYRDSDGNEGNQNESVIIPTVPSGRYYLRVEPEMSPSASGMHYELALRRDVTNFSFFWLAAGLLLIPPIVVGIRSASFEAARWRESDYAPVASSSSDSDGDDD